MIIKHITGTEIDTDKLPDIDAQILEKTEELRQLCSSANRLLLLQVDVKGTNKMTSFWNLKTDADPNNEKTNNSFMTLVYSMHMFFLEFTGNRLGVYPTHAVDFDKLNLDNNNSDE